MKTGHLFVYYVYILQSKSTGRFYIGHCENLIKRFHQHQNGHSPSTHNRGPWWMPYYEVFPTRSDAMTREQEIKKKKSAKCIRAMIQYNLPGIELL